MSWKHARLQCAGICDQDAPGRLWRYPRKEMTPPRSPGRAAMTATSVAFAAGVLGALAGCPEPPEPPAQDDRPPESTPAGMPLGEAVVATIGPDGGTLTSTDGVMNIVIPRDALDSPVQVGVQIVTNHAFGGIGNAYRLSPHDLKLTRPAQLSFQYTDAELGGMFVEAMSVAVQDRDGYWHGKQTVARDDNTRTLSISTMSFAVERDATPRRDARADTPNAPNDWTKFWTFRLVPANARVKVKETLNVDLQFCQRATPTIGWPVEDSFELHQCNPDAPLAGIEIGMWSRKGPGSIQGQGSHAVYTAPAEVPDGNFCSTEGEWHACARLSFRIVKGGKTIDRIASTGIKISDCLFLRSAGGVCEPPTWTGTATYDADTVDGPNTLHAHAVTTVTWTMDPVDPTGHIFMPTGTSIYSATGTRGPCDVTVAPTTLPTHGTLRIMELSAPSPLGYIAGGDAPLGVELDYKLSCGGDTISVPGPLPIWLETGVQPSPQNPAVIAGTFTSKGVISVTSTWSFTRHPPPSP